MNKNVPAWRDTRWDKPVNIQYHFSTTEAFSSKQGWFCHLTNSRHRHWAAFPQGAAYSDAANSSQRWVGAHSCSKNIVLYWIHLTRGRPSLAPFPEEWRRHVNKDIEIPITARLPKITERREERYRIKCLLRRLKELLNKLIQPLLWPARLHLYQDK